MNSNRFSYFFGIIAKFEFFKPFQILINQIYAKIFKIDLSEFDKISKFKSLNALFTRELRAKRSLEHGFISPCDGLNLNCGVGSKNTAISVKNHDYDILELLGGSYDKKELGGEFEFLNIYLSPKDYHHYHAPCDLRVLSLEYIPAKLYSVAPKWLAKIPNLYAKNERVILKAELENGQFLWLVFVGALNVGKMKFDFEQRVETNAKNGAAFYEYSNLSLKKGEHLGNFELGSTILIIAKKGVLDFCVQPNEALKFGKKIAQIV